MDIKTDFAHRLSRVLAQAGYPHHGQQKMLADKLDVTPKAVNYWLNGEKLPTHEKMLAIATLFNVSSEWLATGRGPMFVLTQDEIQHILELRKLSPEDQKKVQQVATVFAPGQKDSAA